MHLLQQEVDSIQDVVSDIVSSMVKRKTAKRDACDVKAQQDNLSQLMRDLASMGLTAAQPGPKHKLLQTPPEPLKVQQVILELQHGMTQLGYSVVQARRSSCSACRHQDCATCQEVDKVRYSIGYNLGTLVRLFYGPTTLQDNPQALPDAFAMALQQTYVQVASENPLQLLIAGLSGISMATAT
jgi:hypothetical protein